MGSEPIMREPQTDHGTGSRLINGTNGRMGRMRSFAKYGAAWHRSVAMSKCSIKMPPFT
jgi:hypothetical protein